MDLMEAIRSRHSVRQYTERKIEGETEAALQEMVDTCNKESGLNIQLILNEPGAFSGMMARYGKFRGVNNYIALVGKKAPGLEEKCGYYGEKVVLRAQQLGLNTCWVAMTYSKNKCTAVVKEGEKRVIIISLGYGENQGVPHKGKSIEALCRVEGEMPDWFRSGIIAAELAPTAINQQKFQFTLSGNTVAASAPSGTNAQIDLGIAKCHFEIGAGDADWRWA